MRSPAALDVRGRGNIRREDRGCYSCGEIGHIAKDCRKTQKRAHINNIQASLDDIAGK
jgi:hypothetical protein